VREKTMRAGGASGGLAGAWINENQETKSKPLKLPLLTRSIRTAPTHQLNPASGPYLDWKIL